MMRRNHCKEGQEKEVRDFRMSYFISLLALIRAHVDFHFLSFFFFLSQSLIFAVEVEVSEYISADKYSNLFNK